MYTPLAVYGVHVHTPLAVYGVQVHTPLAVYGVHVHTPLAVYGVQVHTPLLIIQGLGDRLYGQSLTKFMNLCKMYKTFSMFPGPWYFDEDPHVSFYARATLH